MKRLLLIKCIVMTTLLLAGQMLFAMLTDFKDVPSTVRQVENDMASGADVLYFGDSTLYRGDPAEPDRSTLPELLQRELPDHKVGGAYHDAYNLELMEYFVRHALGNEHPPKVIIIPINMHSLSLERRLRPEYQFVKEKLFLEHTDPLFRAFYRPLAVFKAFDLEPVTQTEYDSTMNYVDGESLGTFAEIARLPDEERLPIHVRATYGYRLDSEHATVKALESIAALCVEAEVQLIVYATPMDYERGDALIEGEFSGYIRANLEVLEAPLLAREIPFHNFAFSLESEMFAADAHGYPDAYLNHAGKQWVAEQLAEAITTSH